MRFSSLIILVVVVSLSHAQQQQQPNNHENNQAPARPQRQSSVGNRLRSMFSNTMGGMNTMYDRLRRGFTRTFSNNPRPNGVRSSNGNSPLSRNQPIVDPAIQTNEIPHRNEGAPNAPLPQRMRDTILNRRPNQFMQRMTRVMGNMRTMFQNWRRGGPSRRSQAHPPKNNNQRVAHAPKAPLNAPQAGEFRPLI